MPFFLYIATTDLSTNIRSSLFWPDLKIDGGALRGHRVLYKDSFEPVLQQRSSTTFIRTIIQDVLVILIRETEKLNRPIAEPKLKY